jgi:hypothetical protein
MTLGVDETKGLDSDRAVPSMFCRQRQARALPDGVIETMERAVKGIDKSERGSLIISYVRVADQKHYDCFTEVQQKVRDWLSPPDPWKNHKIACETQLTGTGTWWIQGQAYAEWNSAGPSALLWIHGKRGCFARSHLISPGTYELSLFSWCRKERTLVRE